MAGNRHSRWFAPTLAAASTGWAAAIGVAPLATHGEGVGSILAAVVYLAGSVVCHQRPERSFHLAAVQLPVCARCTGLYIGGAIGVIAWLIWRRLRSVGTHVHPRAAILAILIAAVPTAITAATAFAGIADISNASRAVLALPLGLVAGAVLAAVASNDLS